MLTYLKEAKKRAQKGGCMRIFEYLPLDEGCSLGPSFPDMAYKNEELIQLYRGTN